MSSKPIGVFDSGVGGLTVLKEIKKTLPYEDLIYLGDTLNFPYGSKKKEEYSTDGAVTSLGSFADSSGMKLVYHKQFNECLKYNDILNQEENLTKTIEEIKKIIKAS